MKALLLAVLLVSMTGCAVDATEPTPAVHADADADAGTSTPDPGGWTVVENADFTLTRVSTLQAGHLAVVFGTNLQATTALVVGGESVAFKAAEGSLAFDPPVLTGATAEVKVYGDNGAVLTLTATVAP